MCRYSLARSPLLSWPSRNLSLHTRATVKIISCLKKGEALMIADSKLRVLIRVKADARPLTERRLRDSPYRLRAFKQR